MGGAIRDAVEKSVDARRKKPFTTGKPVEYSVDEPYITTTKLTTGRPESPKNLVDLSYDAMRPRLPTVMHGAPRILLEAGLPWFMLQRPSYSDDFLLKDLKSIAKPGGISSHSPEVRQAVFESFEKHPALLQHYLQEGDHAERVRERELGGGELAPTVEFD